MKTDRVEVSLLPALDLVEGARKDLEPIALGALSSRPDGIDGNIGIPKDALTPILQTLIAGTAEVHRDAWRAIPAPRRAAA